MRIDMTEDDGSKLIVILDKKDNRVLVKDINQTTWASYPGMTLPSMWEKWVRPYMSLPDERSTTWADIQGEEILVEVEGRTVKIYGIKVDDSIKESIFNPE